MVFKISMPVPATGQSVDVSNFLLRKDVQAFLLENDGKRVAVLFHFKKKKRLRKVRVDFVADASFSGCDTCGGSAPVFRFTR